MIKAAFFDIDGTLLLNPEGTMPASARRALELLQDAGVAVVVATGRAFSELEEGDLLDFPFDGFVTLNGQLCCDGDGTPVLLRPIEGEAAQELVALFEEADVPVFLVDLHGHFINRADERVKRVLGEIGIAVPPAKPYEGQPIFMGGVYVTPDEEPALAARLPHLTFTRWHEGGIDIVGAGGGKELGVAAYLEAKGWTPEEACAFGDGDNDEGMLKLVGLGIAMDNAAPEVQRAADYVTASVREDGVLKAVQERVLPQAWPWAPGTAVPVNDQHVTVREFLGKGKGGYSYLVDTPAGPAVLKQIHHEPCSYYSFGDKLSAEQADYQRLLEAGVPTPELLEVDEARERLLKRYVEGTTVMDLVIGEEVPEDLVGQVRAIAKAAQEAGLNIDYFPTNFVVTDTRPERRLVYVDYECNPYDPQWNLENWGLAYWSRTPQLEAWLAEKG